MHRGKKLCCKNFTPLKKGPQLEANLIRIMASERGVLPETRETEETVSDAKT